MQEQKKWATPVDWVIWVILLVAMIIVSNIMYSIGLEEYKSQQPNIQLKSELQNVPQIIDEVTKLAKEKNKDAILTSVKIEIPGENGVFEKGSKMELGYSMTYKDMIGNGIEKVYFHIDMTDNVITDYYRWDGYSYLSGEITEVEEIDIPKLIDRVSERIDLGNMSKGYGPTLSFDIDRYGDKTSVSAYVFYYTAYDKYGFDWNSKVSQDTKFPLRTD